MPTVAAPAVGVTPLAVEPVVAVTANLLCMALRQGLCQGHRSPLHLSLPLLFITKDAAGPGDVSRLLQ